NATTLWHIDAVEWAPSTASKAAATIIQPRVRFTPESCHDSSSSARPRKTLLRPLPRPLTIPTVIDLFTLADVRTLLGHLPKETRARDTWRHVEAELEKASAGGDTTQVSIALRDGADVGKSRVPAEVANSKASQRRAPR
ncbi:MAG: hypothetical protein WCD52_05775, partial [Xanthobacteraceae bacterium]